MFPQRNMSLCLSNISMSLKVDWFARVGSLYPGKNSPRSKGLFVRKGFVGIRIRSLEIKFREKVSLVPFLWVEFSRGGHGVLAITREQLTEYCNELN